MERLAIRGGTYDPIHEGHLRIADAVQRQLEFDRVLFLPALNPPHKQYRHRFASPEDRLAMVRLAVAPYPYFMASSLEYERGGLSYTYDLVRLLQDRRPDADLALIIGEDSLEQLGTWYRAEDLLRLVRFVVAARPGYRPRKRRSRRRKSGTVCAGACPSAAWCPRRWNAISRKKACTAGPLRRRKTTALKQVPQAKRKESNDS